MKLGWDPDIYPSSLDYEEALKSGKHLNNVSKEVLSKKRINDAHNKGFPSPTITASMPKSKGGLKGLLIALVIAGSLLSSLVEFAKPVIKDFFNGDEPTSTVSLEPGTSQLTSDAGLPVYRIITGDKNIENLGIPSKDTMLDIASGISADNYPYLVVSGLEQTIDLFAISSAIHDEEYMANYLDADQKLLASTYIDYSFPDFDQDGDADVILYMGNDSDYPIVEVFLNQLDENLGFASMGYFESYPVTNLTSDGLIQRIDDNTLYDQIIVDKNGLRILDNK